MPSRLAEFFQSLPKIELHRHLEGSLRLSTLQDITRQVSERETTNDGQQPVIFFNASTRLEYISLNAAYSSLTAWGFRLSGIPVIHFACQAGMSRCAWGAAAGDAGRSTISKTSSAAPSAASSRRTRSISSCAARV